MTFPLVRLLKSYRVINFADKQKAAFIMFLGEKPKTYNKITGKRGFVLHIFQVF